MALAAQASKSPFATLLKRSKFSSFDPAIAQVYTTHGGDAHRGNWGFKRPLPIRRRGAYITVKAVDTLEQQTEWNSAEPQASWMKNWDELQMNPTSEDSLVPGRSLRDHSSAAIADSEFAPNLSDPLKWRPPAIPNIHAMSNTEFKAYLARISRKRRQFFEHKQEQRAKAEAVEEFSHESSQANKARRKKLFVDPAQVDPDEFAMWESQKIRENPRSRSLESVPHSSAGLHYSNFTPLQTYLSTKERKGRLVEEVKGEKGRPLYYVASYAGMGTVVQQQKKGLAHAMSWGDARKTGATKLRPDSVTLERAPEVVGKRQGLKAAKIMMQTFACDAESHSKSNSHRPGSLEYIATEPIKSFSNLSYNLAVPKRNYDRIVDKAVEVHSRKTLDLLEDIIHKRNEGMS